MICEIILPTMPPKRPESLSYEPIEENIPKIKACLLDYFASSTFNNCPHQQLPMIKTEPIKILLVT